MAQRRPYFSCGRKNITFTREPRNRMTFWKKRTPWLSIYTTSSTSFAISFAIGLCPQWVNNRLTLAAVVRSSSVNKITAKTKYTPCNNYSVSIVIDDRLNGENRCRWRSNMYQHKNKWNFMWPASIMQPYYGWCNYELVTRSKNWVS
jgi:hypothetical protein